MGGNVRQFLTGGAPISAEVMDFYKVVFGCHILNGYGMTETFAKGCNTESRDHESGHSGGPGNCILVRLKDVPEMGYYTTDDPPRGEVCFKGPTIF